MIGPRKRVLDMYPVSGMVMLPELIGDEHGAKASATAKLARTPKAPGDALISTNASVSSSPQDDPTIRAQNPQRNTVRRRRRAVMATGNSGDRGKPRDSGAGLCILEHGFGLDATEEGSIGLPEGSTLFAQPLILGGADRLDETQPRRPLDDDNGSTTDRGGGNARMGHRDANHRRHVMLLSDRVRSTTHVLEMSSSGEVAPAVPGVSGVTSSLQISSACSPQSTVGKHTQSVAQTKAQTQRRIPSNLHPPTSDPRSRA